MPSFHTKWFSSILCGQSFDYALSFPLSVPSGLSHIDRRFPASASEPFYRTNFILPAETAQSSASLSAGRHSVQSSDYQRTFPASPPACRQAFPASPPIPGRHSPPAPDSRQAFPSSPPIHGRHSPPALRFTAGIPCQSSDCGSAGMSYLQSRQTGASAIILIQKFPGRYR